MINKAIFEMLTPEEKDELKIILADYVDTETGTGAVQLEFIDKLKMRPDFDTNKLMEEIIKNHNNDVNTGTIVNR